MRNILAAVYFAAVLTACATAGDERAPAEKVHDESTRHHATHRPPRALAISLAPTMVMNGARCASLASDASVDDCE